MKKLFFFGLRIHPLERSIVEKLEKIKATALLDVDLTCSQNISDPHHILDEVGRTIEVLKDEVTKQTDPEIAKLSRQITNTNPEGLQQVTQIQSEELRKKIGNYEIDIKRIPITFSWMQRRYVNYAILVGCAIDSLLNYSSFSLITQTTLGGICLAIVISLGLAGAIHAFANRIRNARHIVMKYLLFFVAIGTATCLFAFLGNQRHEYAEATHTYAFSPFMWVVLCDFFFIAGLLLCISTTPTKAERLSHDAITQKKKQVQKLSTVKNKLFTALRRKEKEHDHFVEKKDLFCHYQEQMLTMLDKQKMMIQSTVVKEYHLKKGNSTQSLLPKNK